MATDLKVRVTKRIKEFIRNECLNTGLSESKVIELHYKDKLPFINTDKIKPKRRQ